MSLALRLELIMMQILLGKGPQQEYSEVAAVYTQSGGAEVCLMMPRESRMPTSRRCRALSGMAGAACRSSKGFLFTRGCILTWQYLAQASGNHERIQCLACRADDASIGRMLITINCKLGAECSAWCCQVQQLRDRRDKEGAGALDVDQLKKLAG